ncbi:tetratricopeptide repeat protein [Streptomyces mirabilis]|uniref:tetratricopeptide repeat protein n=1 Tax=Streptomyces mirabilis TaxID=68239 RepID=UPI002E1D1A29
MNTRHGRLPGQEPEPFRVEDLPQPARRLAVVLSTATRIEPELMRTARLELRPTLDVGAEATLWFGDWASRSGADHMALHHDLLIPLRGLLSAELAADPGKGAVRRTGAVISRAHRGLSPALALEEQVTWAAVLADAGLATDGGDDPDTAIDRMLERVLRAALEEPDRREGLRRWFAGAWQRFPERVRLAPGAQTLFDVLVQGGGPDASASGHPSPLRFEGSTDIVLTLRHDGAYITAGDPVWPVEGILVPDTHPRVLDVSSDPVNWSRAQKLRVPRHGTAAVDVSHVPVYVRNARGVIYQLGAPDSSATVRYGLPGAVPMQDDLDAEVAADNPADALVGSGRPPRIHEEATEHDSAGPASPEQPEQPEQFDQYEPTRSGVFLSPPYGQIATPLHGGVARDILIEILSPTRDHRSRVHVLAGIGGSGKSRIALEAAHRLRESRTVWWVRADQITTAMREVAYQLGTPRSLFDQAVSNGDAPHDIVWSALEAAPEPWLLVFDNVDQPSQLGYRGRDAAEGTGWLREPRTPHGLVIVTSRNQSRWPSNSMVHLVHSLDEVDGAAMLLESVPRAGTMDQARELAVTLGCLPLALHTAVAYLNSVTNTSLSGPAVHDFETYTQAIRSRTDETPGMSDRGLHSVLGLDVKSRVCGMSLELLTRSGLPEAAPLLKLFACLAPTPIPVDALMSSDTIELSPLFAGPSRFSRAKRNAALRGLADLCLIEVEAERPGAEPADPAVSHPVPLIHLHPVIHGLMRADEDVRRRPVDYQRLNLQLLEGIAQELPPDMPANWGLWATVAPHAIEVVRAALHTGMYAPDLDVALSALVLARLTARYLIAVGVLPTAAALVNPIIAGCETFGFDEDSPDILQLKFERGRVALEAGQALDAEDEFARIAVVREQVLGAHHPDTLAARHALARSVLEQGRFAEAESLLRAIVQIEYAVHGTEHPDTLVTRHSLVRATMALGHVSEVLDEARDLLAVSLRQLGHDNPETLRIRQTLTRILLQTDRTDEAEREIDTALSNSMLAPDSPLTMALRHTRCLILVTRGRIAEAAEELASLLEDQIRSQGPGHPETERTREMLQRVEEILST